MKLYLIRLLTYIVPTATLRNSATVRFAFPLLFVVAGFLGIANVVSTTASAIQLELKTAVVTKNSDFAIDVFATANVPVNAVTISIEYPEDTIEVLGIDRGQSVITLWTEDPKAENGIITLSGGTYRKGFVGKHLIATITARAKRDGKANFVVKTAELLAGDGKATAVATKIDDSKAEVAIAREAVASSSNGEIRQVSVFVVTDIDHDGHVSMADISTFMKNWMAGSSLYDFNNDGKMTINDFSILLSAYITS